MIVDEIAFFSDEQRVCMESIVEIFAQPVCHEVLLLAEVQSGKTNSYLLTACELIHRKIVKRCVVVSAITDRQLKTQLLQNVHDAVEAYRDVLAEEYEDEDEDDKTSFAVMSKQINAEIRMIQTKICVCWGNEMYKFDVQMRDTCVFLEESHFAQDREMKTDEFFEKQNIKLGGHSAVEMAARNLFVVSISATPFSEISDLLIHNQPKKIVRLRSGAAYRGLGHFWRKGQIHGFETELLSENLEELAVNMAVDKYAIIRVLGSDAEKAAAIARKHNIQIAEINGDDSAKTRRVVKKMKFNELAVAPERATWVLVKGMGRLGQVVPKQHIQFVMETSKEPKVDTVIQGLMGRMFGYYPAECNVQVYISQRIMDKDDLDRALTFYEEGAVGCIPRHARNICAGRDPKPPAADAPPVPMVVPRTNGREIFS